MKKTAWIVIAILSLVTNYSLAQKRDREAFDSAYIYFSLENYQRALPIFLRLYGADPENANLAFHIGVCYKHMPSDKFNAIPYLEKASVKVSEEYSDNYDEKKAPVITFFYLGTAYLINYDLSKAIAATEKYKTFLKEKTDGENIINANRQISMCKVAREMIKNPIPIQVENLGSHINTNFPEYAPVVDVSGNVLFFTSRRNTNVGELIEDNGYYFEDIYISNKEKNNKWGEAVNIGKSINTEDHEASISLSPDKKQLFIYKDDGGDGNIYVSNYDNKEWSSPRKLSSPVNTGAWETHASLSPDGKTLYFTSDRKGGYGGLDIYMVTKLPNGNWGEAKNLGDVINTEYNEDGPFILSNNTLYFCSEGHNTMGGYDIFYSRLKNDATWSEPVNMGYPINTTDNDMYYTPIDSANAYFASVRVVDDFQTRGFGNLDIYRLTIHEVKIRGIAYDKQTNKIITGAKISLMNEKMEEIAIAFSDDKGAYSFAADYNRNYNLKGQKEFYSDGNNSASTYNIGDAKEVTANLLLEKNIVAVSLKIEVTDAGTGEPIKDVSVPLKDAKSGKLENFLTNVNGEIFKSLDDKTINDSIYYHINFSKEGYESKYLTYRYHIVTPGEILIKEQLNKSIPSKIIIRGVAYDKNTNKIIPGTEVTLMNEKMEIISKVFADEKGAYSFTAEYNRNYNLKGQKDAFSDGFNTASTINARNAKEVTANLLLEKATTVSLRLQITDAQTGEPLKDVSVVLTDEKTGIVENLTTDEKGEILKSLDNKKINDSLVYNIKLNKECFIEKIIDFRYRISKSGEILIKEMIGKIGVGADLAKIFKINPIYFDLDKYYIRPDAAIELDKIVKIMNEYPDMVIELGSHTDCRASYAYNNKLSDNRAKSSAEYIRKRITNPERIYGKGYGETKLVNRCECEGSKVVPCTEEEHQMNRRTEFIIISVGDDNTGKTGEIKINGTAYEMGSNVPVPGAEVTLMDEKTEVVGRTFTDQNGKYSFIAEYDKNYQLNGKKNSYEDGSISVSTFHLCNARQKTADIKLKKSFSAVLKIQVTDAKTKQPLQDVNVLLKDVKSDKSENYKTNEFGEIVKNLDDKKIYDSLCYEITLSKDSYITKVIPYKNIVSRFGEILIKETIGKIEVGADLGKIFQINPIYFDLGKYDIRPDAALELDKIVNIMNEYQDMVIELGSHTDCRSSFDFNITLSNNRAKASASYIQKRITNPLRIYGKGYGETKLVNKCECEGTRVVPCTEEEHQMNRRTEFIIISY
ncbi:MAG TPA: OmpA family protein [Bacteroidales bacterium]|nr:OmpA family protein [Bacteroidales bacterium]